MKKINVCELDQKLNSEKLISYDKAMLKVAKHINKNIDPTFPFEDFKSWYESGVEKDFVWNNVRYHWGNK